MYDLAKIVNCIDRPENITSADVDLFEKLAADHAYSPVFSILYLKALSMYDSLSFESKLKDHAYKVPSRTRLYALIQEVDEVPASEIKEPDLDVLHTNEAATENTLTVTTNEQQSSKEEQTGVDDETSHETIEDRPTETDEISLEKTEVENKLQSAAPDEQVAREPVDDQKTEKGHNTVEKSSKKEKSEFDPLEKEMLAHAVGSSISLEIDDFISEETFAFQNQKFKEQSEGGEESRTEEQQNELQPEERAKETSVDFSKSRSFTEWLNLASNEDKITQNTNLPAPKKKKKKIKITEKKVSKPFFSAVDKAKESLDYTGIPVTETLAKIYDAQGNFPRAMEAYEQLILKIPEKKVFFALQIEKLKKKLNQ